MAHTSQSDPGFDVEARHPSIPAILGLTLVAIALALALVVALGALVMGT